MIDWNNLLILFESYGGVYNQFIEAIYLSYKKDFIFSKPYYLSKPIQVKRTPIVQDKEENFWHITTSGDKNRQADIRRCERIKWPSKIIKNSTDNEFLVWENERHNRTRILIYLESQHYVVVLEKRKTYILFVTAYPVNESHSRRKMLKEYEAYKKQEPHT